MPTKKQTESKNSKKSKQYSTAGTIAGGTGGALIGGPMGAMIGAGIGGSLGGMLAPQEEYTSPSFSDIDLQKENPELWAQLQKYNQMGSQLEALYNQRSTGPSMMEERGRQQQMADMNAQLQSRGMLGGSTALLAGNDLNAQFQNQIAQRIAQEQQQLMGQRMQQGAQYNQMLSNAQNNIMQNMTGEAMQNYQARQAEDQARNQFYAGLAQGGAQMYGANQQANAMNKNTEMLRSQNDMYYNNDGLDRALANDQYQYQSPSVYQGVPGDQGQFVKKQQYYYPGQSTVGGGYSPYGGMS